METSMKPSFFDRPLTAVLKLDWEKAIYLVIFVLAVLSRFWILGARAMSHDESLHALYSYYLYNGSGYVHNPMMHGPFLFHANALIYFLFGDNDFTARIMPALFGVFMVMSPLLLRRWLGRAGAVITATLLLISPSFLYYSRYIRNDIYIAVWSILLIAALFHFIQSRKPGWFFLAAAVLMLSLATKENAYIFGYIGLVYVVEVILWEKVSHRNQVWLYLGGAALSLILLLAAFFLGRLPVEAAEAGVEAAEAATSSTAAIQKLVLSIITVLGGTLPAALISASLLRSRHPRPSSVEEALRSLSWQDWLIAAVVMFLIYALLFTTFFTNPVGLGTGIFGSISYWLAQQEVQRGGQPWYYYFLVLTMYEFLPLLFSIIATVYYLVRSLSSPRTEQVEPPVSQYSDLLLDEEPDSAPARERGPGFFANASEGRFVAFLIFWNISTIFIYSWAGEKMPWLVLHPALPMIVLTGKFAGDMFQAVDWRAVWKRGGALLALLLPITLFGLYTLVKLQLVGSAAGDALATGPDGHRHQTGRAAVHLPGRPGHVHGSPGGLYRALFLDGELYQLRLCHRAPGLCPWGR
jgi:uncharacterized protein (TIGR03663 family)